MPRTRGRYLFILLVILIAAGNVRILLRSPLNNDVSWYLYVGQAMLEGKRLYIDLLETNPPLVAFLSVIPVWLADTLGIAPKPLWIMLTTALITGLAAVAAYYWGKACGARYSERALTFVFLLLLSETYIFALDYGQRDHLAFVGSLAAIGLLAAHASGAAVSRKVSLPASVVAGLLLALKPFFLIPWFVCLGYAVHRRNGKEMARRPEVWITPAMSLTQPLLVAFVTPSYLHLARTISELYSSYSAESWSSLLRGHIAMATMAGILLAFLVRTSERSRATVRMALLMAMGWCLSGLLQRKGWHYHMLPGFAALAVAAWLILLDHLAADQTMPVRRSRLTFQTATLSLLLTGLLGFAGLRAFALRWDYAPGLKELIPLLRREARKGSVVGLGTGMFLFPVIDATEGHFGSHYNCLWPLPGLYSDQIRTGADGIAWRYRSPGQMPAAEEEMFNAVYADLAARPRLIIFAHQKNQQGMGPLSVDLVRYFRQDDRIRAVLTNYEQVPFKGEFLVLRQRGNLQKP